jgi:hypothetical protein
MELPITLLADHHLQLGNFTSAHLGTFKSALTPGMYSKPPPTTHPSRVVLAKVELSSPLFTCIR